VLPRPQILIRCKPYRRLVVGPTAITILLREPVKCVVTAPQMGKILASLIMDSVPARSAMIFVMCTVAAGNVVFSFGSSMNWFCVSWCIARIIHVRRAGPHAKGHVVSLISCADVMCTSFRVLRQTGCWI